MVVANVRVLPNGDSPYRVEVPDDCTVEQACSLICGEILPDKGGGAALGVSAHRRLECVWTQLVRADVSLVSAFKEGRPLDLFLFPPSEPGTASPARTSLDSPTPPKKKPDAAPKEGSRKDTIRTCTSVKSALIQNRIQSLMEGSSGSLDGDAASRPASTGSIATTASNFSPTPMVPSQLRSSASAAIPTVPAKREDGNKARNANVRKSIPKVKPVETPQDNPVDRNSLPATPKTPVEAGVSSDSSVDRTRSATVASAGKEKKRDERERKKQVRKMQKQMQEQQISTEGRKVHTQFLKVCRSRVPLGDLVDNSRRCLSLYSGRRSAEQIPSSPLVPESPRPQQQKESAEAVTAILNSRVTWSSENEEVQEFRRRMREMREQLKSSKSSARRSIVHTSSFGRQSSDIDQQLRNVLPIYKASDPLSDADAKRRVKVRIRLASKSAPEDQSALYKTLLCHMSDPITAVLQSSIAKFQRDQSAVAKPNAYVLKKTGKAEYLLGEDTLGTFTCVRECLSKGSDLDLTMIPKEDVLDQVTNATSHVDDLSASGNHHLAYMGTSGEEIEHSELTLGGGTATWKAAQKISFWDIDFPLRVRVVGADNLTRDVKDFAALESLGDNKDSYALFVSMEMYHGNDRLCNPLFTYAVPFSQSPRWCRWLNCRLPLSSFPKATRLCFTLWARPSNRVDAGPTSELDSTIKKDTPLAWVNCPLLKYDGILRSGVTQMRMWLNDKAHPIGQCVENVGTNQVPALTIEIDAFQKPVLFPVGKPPSNFIETPAGEPGDQEARQLQKIVDYDPLYRLKPAEQTLLWKYRHFLKGNPKALLKVLHAVKWNNPACVFEMHTLIDEWAPLEAHAALELLDAHHADPYVRQYAVERLEELTDEQLNDYVLQLSQVLKYEPYHDTALARYLLRRAVKSPYVIGHTLFWHLKAEMHVKHMCERNGLLLEEYLQTCGRHIGTLLEQTNLLKTLANIAKQIKDTNTDRVQLLRELVADLTLPEKFTIPLSPRLEACGILPQKCRVMDSKKLPLWLVFKNADPNGAPISVMFKSGDDIRQDMLTLQMLRTMDHLWKEAGLDVILIPYGCLATGNEEGMLEIVLNSATIATIMKGYAGARGAFSDKPLAEWLRKHNSADDQFYRAQVNFSKSAAAYCVATYVLGIGDRHNDNIMLREDGTLFHIDFGHFLGHYKSFAGINREPAPFIFTNAYAAVMGSEKGDLYKSFVKLCGDAYNVLRRHGHLFMNLFALMLGTGIPELQSVDDINVLRDRLQLHLSDEAAASFFADLISRSLGSFRTKVNDYFHMIVHPD